jgi:hypothetical protein
MVLLVVTESLAAKQYVTDISSLVWSDISD